MRKFTFFCAAIFACSTMLTFAGNRANVVIPGDHFPKSFRMDPRVTERDYLPKTIIFKVRAEYRQNCKATSIDNILPLQDLLNSIGAQNVAKMFPNDRAPEKKFNEVGMKLVDLSLMYSFKYTADRKLEKVINQLLGLGYFEYVEPWYVPTTQAISTPQAVPNDPSYSAQYHLQGNTVGSIDTQNAWNSTTGSASVVIGIPDTGTEPTHPDLAGNYLGGYDVGMNDADPTWQGSNHGCVVSGDACAVTNNGVGVASPGYNCKFKAIKIADATGALVASYTGLKWAADNGCKIINCSWGGPGGGTAQQDIIDYATINKNCLVFAAAGNGSIEEFQYPSSFNNVYRIASTTPSDGRSGFSSYGVDVDFAAPGSSIYSTSNGSGYQYSDGTSMASPVASGAAALVQSHYNYSNSFQIGERLKQTCDPFAGSATINLFNAGKMGKGRIDVAKAVNNSIAAKSIVMNPINITDGNNNIFLPSESITISGTFINYLDATSSSASAVLTIVSGPGTITNGSYTIGAMATLATQTMATPFTVTIQSTAAVNSTIKFKVTTVDGTFTNSQYFEIVVNPDYINIVNNDVHTSITSKGRIGYNLDAVAQGLGFEYQLPATQMLYEMSLMIGSSSTKVSDMFRETTTGNTDFTSTTRVYEVNPATVSDFDLDGKFTDATSPSPNPVEVRHSAFAWSTAPYRKFVIVKYVIKNTGATTLSNVAVGIMADWDITDAGKNKGGYDAANKMGYCYDVSTTSGKYAGIKLLTNGGTPNNYIIDLWATPAGNGGVDADTDFLTAEKYTTLTTTRNTDNFTATGGDVMECMSTNGLTINAGDSLTVAFALIGGDNLADIQASACAAQSKYDSGCVVGVNDLEADNLWMYSYPNPATNSFNIDYNVVESNNTTIRIMNALGEVIMTFENIAQGKHTLKIDASKFSSGHYFYQMKSADAVLTKKLTIAK